MYKRIQVAGGKSSKAMQATWVSLREHREMWGTARREGRVVQSEDVNGKGLQRRGGKHSSEENCERAREEPWRGWEGFSGRGEKQRDKQQLSLWMGRAGNGVHLLCRIGNFIVNLKQPHRSQELGKCPFGRWNEEVGESSESHVFSYVMLKQISVQRAFGEGIAGVVLTLGLVVPGVRYLPFPWLSVGLSNSV